MNRQIKFRVWCPNHKNFLNSYKGKGLSFSNCSDELMEEFGCYDLEQCIDFGYPVNQFTGIVDRNGIEIYEGDIVEETWSENYPYGYNPDEFVSRQDYFIVEYKSASFNFPDRRHHQVVIENYKLKVIGNIYENPDKIVVIK